MNRVFWTNDAPCGMTLDRLLYEIRKEDGENGLIFDSVSIEDIMADADEAATFDALVMPYNRLERSMNVMLTVMKRAAQEIQPVSRLPPSLNSRTGRPFPSSSTTLMQRRRSWGRRMSLFRGNGSSIRRTSRLLLRLNAVPT